LFQRHSRQETLSNSETIKKWFLTSNSQVDIAKHFVAVSTNIEKVTAFGIDLIMFFNVGLGRGRFLFGAVGLTISLAIGNKNFEELQQGANEMDEHFKTADFENNMPVVWLY
jgi:glucose-6-phosphate isomerase